MSKKSRKKRQKIDVEFDEDGFDDMYDDDYDLDNLSRDIYSTEWGNYEFDNDKRGGSDARRRIERHRDMKKLYSELNDWEEFGTEDSW
jgi:hypothetical protein